MPGGAVTRARATIFAGPDVDVPPRRRAVLAIAAMAVGSFAIGTSEYVTMGLLPEISAGLDVSIPQGGHLISAYAVGVHDQHAPAGGSHAACRGTGLSRIHRTKTGVDRAHPSG